MKNTLFLAVAAITALAFKSDMPAYILYDAEGRNVKYQKMIETISSADVVFFGELHDNPISHWLELEVTAALHRVAGNNLVIGAEMFEADNQLLGSRDLFRSSFALEREVGDHAGLQLYWEHMSHGQILDKGRNQGLDYVGLRFLYRFDPDAARD